MLNNCLAVSLFFALVTVPVTGFDIEPKRPLSPSQELKVTQDGRSITVSGETFTYTFRKDNGLIGSVKVLGREMTDGVPVPGLMVAEHLDSAFSPYLARYETAAHVELVADKARAVVRAEGAYTAADGRRFPLRYDLTYDISIDGVILVTLRNTATEACSFRWLMLSAGAVPAERAQFLNWMPEQSTSQATHYQFRALSGDTGETVLSGTWIPWIWIGDQNTGLEVTTWDVNSQTYNRLDSTARNDEPAMFGVRRENGFVRWENYLVRRTRVHANPGWTRSGAFALAVTPSKKFDASYALLKGAHLGPHQHVTKLTLPDERQIRTLAQNGYNLVVGMANWRSGEYVPLNDTELRRTIDLCHKHGLKIIPYITLVDLSHATGTYRQSGEEWAIEPATEFVHHLRPNDWKAESAYRNDAEEETTLMCPGAEGWRAHWKRQIDRVIRDYDFDGIYFDFWFGRMVCENARHGCGGRFRKGTVLGSREMLMYAYNRLKAKNPRAIIKANTNTLATALITSLVDIRLVGEAIDAAGMDLASRQWLSSSYRLGEPTEFLWDETRWTPAQKASFAALVNFLPQSYHRPRFEPRSAYDDFDVFRSFDDGSGAWHLGISGQSRLKAEPAEVSVNVVEREGAMLATLINTASSPVTAEIPHPGGWLAYEPLAEKLLASGAGGLKVDLAAGAYRHLLLTREPETALLLFALGARVPAKQSFDPGARRLRFSAEAAEGARIRFALYSPKPVRKITNSRGETVPFESRAGALLVVFEVAHTPGDHYEVTF